MIQTALGKPVTLAMLALGLAVFGTISFTRLPVDLLPDVSYPTLTVRSAFPGASAWEVESLVSRPLEERLGVVGGLKRCLSISRAEEAEVVLHFAWQQNMDLKVMDIREKLDLYQGPAGSRPPRIVRYDPREDPVMRLALRGADLRTLYREAELIKRDLEPLAGVAKVDLAGHEDEELVVEVDPARAWLHGLSVEQVGLKLEAENVNAASGILETEGGNYTLRVVNELKDPARLDRIEIPLGEGRAVPLGNLGRSVLRPLRSTSAVHLDGDACVELAIYKEGDGNSVEVARTLRRRLASLEERRIEGLKVDVIFDQSVYIEQALQQVVRNAASGGGLAVLVLALFLARLSLALLVACAIPLSILGTFMVMHVLGVGANLMSLGGLALGAGMMVDSSIVVLEAIFQKREKGLDPMTAALEGTREVAGAVIASTLTTIVVFLPAVFLSGLAAQVFGDLSITVSVSLLMSLLVSLALIPCFAARIGDVTSGPPPTFTVSRRLHLLVRLARLPVRLLGLVLAPVFWAGRTGLDRSGRVVRHMYRGAERAYQRSLEWSLGRPAVVLGLLFLLGIDAGRRALRVRLDLVPELRRGEFDVVVQYPEGTSLAATVRGLEGFETGLRRLDGVTSVFLRVGSSPDSGGRTESEEGENVGVFHVTLDGSFLDREEEVFGRVRALAGALEGARGPRARIRKNVPFTLTPPIEVFVFGDDLEAMMAVAARVREEVAALPGVGDVETSLRFGAPQIDIHFRRAVMARMGIDQQEIVDVLTRRIQGKSIGRIVREGRTLDLVVRGRQDRTPAATELEQMVVKQVSGVPVHLGTIARVEPGLGPTAIRRLNQERVVMIQARLISGDLARFQRQLRTRLDAIPVTPGIRVTPGGRSEELAEAARSLIFALALALFLIYCVMASQFESVVSPVLVLVSVPLAAIGVIFALDLTGSPLSLVSFMGVIFLAGIAVNNAIVLVDAINQRLAAGVALDEALFEACVVRLRPITMTTATTLIGLVPMVVSRGRGSELSAPMAVTVLGGLAMSTLLTLYLIPVLYRLVHRRRPAGPAVPEVLP